MTFSQKSINFVKKILQYNPLPTKHQHKHQERDQNNYKNCSQNHNQQIKPYLHVHDHRKEREIYQKPTKQKLDCMKSFKELGNEYFRQKQYQQASHYYNKIIIFSDYTFPQEQKQQKQMDELVQQANCNLGMALLKLELSKNALDSFLQACKGPQQKILLKAYYWLVKCYMNEGNFEKAHENLSKLKQFGQATLHEVTELDLQLRKAKETYEKKSKSIFRNIFQQNQTQAENFF